MTPTARPTALQLYTLREQAADDFRSVLSLAAEIGFVGVEPAGLHGLSPAQMLSALDELGLELSSTHGPLPEGPDAERIVAEHAGLRTPALICSLRPDDFASADAVHRTAERFAAGSQRAASSGVTLGYHNHWWEFAQQVDGRSSYETFLAELESMGVTPPLEVDLYWVQVAGEDPAGVLGKLGERVRFVHVKDGPATKDAPMTALGEGVVDIPRVLAAGQDVRWHIVELDRCATDMVTAVRASYDYLVSHGLSSGRRS